MRTKIIKRDSVYFPYMVTWEIGKVKYSNVFETLEKAEMFIEVLK